jgi:hypothetical protein
MCSSPQNYQAHSCSRQIIGIIGLAGGGVIAVGGVIQANRSCRSVRFQIISFADCPDIPAGNKLAYIIQIFVYGLLAVLSVLG